MNSALRQFFALVFAAVASTAGAQSTFILGPYQYDGSGNVTGVGMDAQYRYDAYGRLGMSQIYVNSNLHTQEFTYDRFGNITTIATNGTPMNLGVNSATNRLTTGLPGAGIFGTHDDDGNITSYTGSTTFEPDELGMVRRAELEGHKKVYLYTADEQRIATIDLTPAGLEDDSLWTLRDLSGKVLREYRKTTASGEQWQWREDYIYRGGSLLAAEVPGDTLHFHPDHLGTPRLITNALGAKVSEHTYAPFGVELTAAGTQRMKFTGHERDVPNLDQPTLGKALDYMHARYYTPGGGRFLSVDPVLDVKRALTNPQTWNRYSYALNRPTGYVDPDGRMGQEAMERLVLIGYLLYTENAFQGKIHTTLHGEKANSGFQLGIKGMNYVSFDITDTMNPEAPHSINFTVQGQYLGVETEMTLSGPKQLYLLAGPLAKSVFAKDSDKVSITLGAGSKFFSFELQLDRLLSGLFQYMTMSTPELRVEVYGTLEREGYRFVNGQLVRVIQKK